MRPFWKYTLASLTGSFLFVVLMSILLGLGAVGLLGMVVASLARGSGTPEVEKDSILVYDLSTEIPDSESIPSPGQVVFGGGVPHQLTLREAINALGKAAQDDRIAGLYLKGSDLDMGTGLAAQQELHQAITAFKASGKPIIAYDVSWSEREYDLAALADTLYLNPFGEIEMNGLYAETMYQAKALNKLGVGVQVTRVGKYKSAVEPLIRDNMSPAEKQQTQQLLGDLWQTIISEAAQPRKISPQQLQTIANTQGFLFGDEAKTQNLVDGIAYEDEVMTALRKVTGQTKAGEDDAQADAKASDSFRQISLNRYAEVVDDDRVKRSADSQIALVYAEGPIVDGDGGDGFSQTNVIAGDRLASQLRQLRHDDQVKAVVLRVNSPGGSAIASEIILREVRLLQKAGKPVVVSMGNVAASGGYWISSMADAIVAEPTTITGSIGVFSLFINLEGLGDKVGISWDGVKTADLADIFSNTRPKTDQELAILQKSVDHIYDEFLDRVAEGRHLPREKVAEIAQGRVWSGQTAKKLGLVDELGGLDQAIDKAASLAKLGDDWRLQEYPEADTWHRFLSAFWRQDRAATTTRLDPLTQQITQMVGDLDLLRTLNDPQGLYLLMPFTIKVH